MRALPLWHMCLEIQECDGGGKEQVTKRWELMDFATTGSGTHRHTKCEKELNDDMAFCLRE